MAKIFRGVTPAAQPLSRVWSIMKLILRFSISIINGWSGPSSLQVSPRINSLAGHRNSNGCTESITRIIPIRRSHAIRPRCPKTFTSRRTLSGTTADTTQTLSTAISQNILTSGLRDVARRIR